VLEIYNTQLSPSKKIKLNGNDGYMNCKLVYYGTSLLTAAFVWCLFFDKLRNCILPMQKQQ